MRLKEAVKEVFGDSVKLDGELRKFPKSFEIRNVPHSSWLLGDLLGFVIQTEEGKLEYLYFTGSYPLLCSNRKGSQLFISMTRGAKVKELNGEKQLKEMLAENFKHYTAFHEGLKPDKILNVEFPSQEDFKNAKIPGAIRLVAYIANKGREKDITYVHKHDSPYPFLIQSKNNFAYHGGTYIIGPPGIVH